MSNNAIEQLEAVIAHKREELKELLLARESLQHIGKLMGPDAVAITVHLQDGPLQLGPAPEEAKPAPRARKKPGPKPGKDPGRKSAIKRAVEKKRRAQGATGNKRRKYTTEFKLKVLKECEKARTNAEVCEKYGIYPSNIITWQRQKADGKLRPSAGEVEAPSLELPEADEDGTAEVMIQREVFDDIDYEGPLDLVAELAGEEPPQDPFVPGQAAKEEMALPLSLGG